MTIAAAARSNIADWAVAAVRPKNWRARLSPPKKKPAPRASREFPRDHRGGGGGARGPAEDGGAALRPAEEHRGAEDEQVVPEDRPHERRLDALVYPRPQREGGDDQLGRVAERHVEHPADPRPRARG